MVSSGLELHGGGRTLLGRLLAAGCASHAREHGLSFSILSLGSEDAAYRPPAPARYARGRRTVLACRTLAAQLGRRSPAIVFDLLGPARVQSLLPRSLQSPYLVAMLGIEVWRPLSPTRRRALAGSAIRLAISETTRRLALPHLPANARDCEVLHLALEERPPSGEADDALLSRVGSDFLLMVGRMSTLEAYKGHDRILEALSRLTASAERARALPTLVVAGGGDDRPRLEARARELGLTDRVAFTGHVSEATLRRLYERCAAFVMPSRGEGFGLVYLEAMRAGKACVALRGTVAEEIVVDGVTGRLVDPAAPEELAAAIVDLVGDPEQARRLGAAGRKRLAERFPYARFEAGLHGHLDRLTAL
ncbi:MAG TPA: glycosyltransferase family 4 protein [Thermoanaerobaculia bacterium]|nr:glycosyltransferase family 4 protein [Thermoanaerobaculia bacterium]